MTYGYEKGAASRIPIRVERCHADAHHRRAAGHLHRDAVQPHLQRRPRGPRSPRGCRWSRGCGPLDALPGARGERPVLAERLLRTVLGLLLVAVATLGVGIPSGRAETGVDAWLRYPRIRDAAVTVQYSQLPAVVVVLGDSPVLNSAREELLRGIAGMLGRSLRVESRLPAESAIVLGTADALESASLGEPRAIAPDGFHIHVRATNSALRRTTNSTKAERFVVAGGTDRAVLYGVFALLRLIGLHRSLDDIDLREQPSAPIRWVNQWDNLDGTIERGYGGRLRLLRRWARPGGPVAGERLRAAAGVARLERLLRQQRQRRYATAHGRVPSGAGPPGRNVPAVGRSSGAGG